MAIPASPPITAAQIYAECQSPGLPFDMASAVARELAVTPSGAINIASFLGKDWDAAIGAGTLTEPLGHFDSNVAALAITPDGSSFISGEALNGEVAIHRDLGAAYWIVSHTLTALTSNGATTAQWWGEYSLDNSSWSMIWDVVPNTSLTFTNTTKFRARYLRIRKVNTVASRLTLDGWQLFGHL